MLPFAQKYDTDALENTDSLSDDVLSGLKRLAAALYGDRDMIDKVCSVTAAPLSPWFALIRCRIAPAARSM